ncbi:MAG: Cof-type HAD-IIB family hydrolase [Sarcina sp.]
MNLYISDLDGTLLNQNREVTEYSKIVINNLIDKGLDFTIATARTPGTVVEILKGININKPIALMNGVFLYDLNKKEYLKVREIEKEKVIKILNILESFNKTSFMYGIKNNHLNVYHKEILLDLDKVYFDERKNSKYKTFELVTNYYEAIEDLQVVNFMILDKEEVIKVLFEKLSIIEGINIAYYKDVYDENCYFIEIHSDKASKKQAVADLKEIYKPNKVICFGDNLNDLSMFEVANEKYAMENAVQELKAIATGIIESNENDGVARYLEENFMI